ncbi:MFS transporter [Nanchangia anserum]|uniref:MFS transporter n=1 Tax=Nanchangia anserum TaxID=2692125 RepID=A0A8I0GAJ6_9ACTO|nr:MFS transporter [Nanchangia anserum]MBD3689248.1 MFS transporter [Nanchangia anserum]QOX81471.1 MFS transporter [Nanchangia anserum]
MPTTSSRAWAGLAVLAVGVGLIVIDGTIVGVSLPTIITDLGLALTTAEWVNALYSVIFAALLLSFGKAGDIFGTARLFRLGVAAFVIGSLIAALSRTAEPLIAARAIQGVGAAAVLPSSLSTLNQMFTGRERTIAFGAWGATMAGAAAIGPLAGGWLTTNWSWPLIFWVNVPIGIVLVALGYVVLPAREGERRGRLDPLGLVLSILFAAPAVFAIIEGETLGWWRARAGVVIGSWRIVDKGDFSPIPLIGTFALVMLGLFLWWQTRASEPLLALSLFRLPAFTWGNVAALVISAGEYVLVFVLPLYLIADRGLSPMGAGWVLAAMAGGAFLAGAGARGLSLFLSSASVVIVGVGLELIGVCLSSWCVNAGANLWAMAACLAVYGAGLGFASAQLTSTILADVPAHRSGQGSATQSTMRQFGAAAGTAIAGTLIAILLPDRIIERLSELGIGGEQAHGIADAVTQSAGAALTGLASQADAGKLGPAGPDIVAAAREAFAASVSHILWAAAACLLIGVAAAIRVRAVATRGATGSTKH